ncbi:uncharacterized protein BT62DRAFT_1006945 [Guyanagaster necrorhizus]|uniref:Uncharacterized protein n=1 Tax=Guyanagaster necrorhizus TaxID=856835 RepID=A0A9P8ASV5_9AGAR|nr:uncharacterized protein BT62DRAFT_1006945 [Guyanagaster necrorhizus MCA 3950]KAG7445252.1 hypothetical protein BT62DRAFT_1006945 [Guyanagaster necrorhizus MCA 3950]
MTEWCCVGITSLLKSPDFKCDPSSFLTLHLLTLRMVKFSTCSPSELGHPRLRANLLKGFQFTSHPPPCFGKESRWNAEATFGALFPPAVIMSTDVNGYLAPIFQRPILNSFLHRWSEARRSNVNQAAVTPYSNRRYTDFYENLWMRGAFVDSSTSAFRSLATRRKTNFPFFQLLCLTFSLYTSLASIKARRCYEYTREGSE